MKQQRSKGWFMWHRVTPLFHLCASPIHAPTCSSLPSPSPIPMRAQPLPAPLSLSPPADAPAPAISPYSSLCMTSLSWPPDATLLPWHSCKTPLFWPLVQLPPPSLKYNYLFSIPYKIYNDLFLNFHVQHLPLSPGPSLPFLSPLVETPFPSLNSK